MSHRSLAYDFSQSDRQGESLCSVVRITCSSHEHRVSSFDLHASVCSCMRGVCAQPCVVCPHPATACAELPGTCAFLRSCVLNEVLAKVQAHLREGHLRVRRLASSELVEQDAEGPHVC